jgi:hypothetical protein
LRNVESKRLAFGLASFAFQYHARVVLFILSTEPKWFCLHCQQFHSGVVYIVHRTTCMLITMKDGGRFQRGV